MMRHGMPSTSLHRSMRPEDLGTPADGLCDCSDFAASFLCGVWNIAVGRLM